MLTQRGTVLEFRRWHTPEMPENPMPPDIRGLLKEAEELVTQLYFRTGFIDEMEALLTCLRPLFADQPAVLHHMHADDIVDDFDGFRERWLEVGRLSAEKLRLSCRTENDTLVHRDMLTMHLAIVVNDLIDHRPKMALSAFTKMQKVVLNGPFRRSHTAA